MRILTYLLTLMMVFTATSVLACVGRYEIVRGDTLSTIAAAEMGSIWEYPRLHEANYDLIGDNPNVIRIGDTLTIPCTTVTLGEVDWSIMPTPQVFATLKRQEDIQVLDIRSELEVQNSYIPGAIWIPFNEWRGPENNPGAPKSAVAYSAMIGDAGLRVDKPTIIVHSEGAPLSTGSSAYVYWVLKSLGADQLAILRGGHRAWVEAGYETQKRPSKAKPYRARLTFSNEWRATQNLVSEVSFQQRPGVLLDARPHHMFNRYDKLGQLVQNTIPGAAHLPATPLIESLKGEFDIEDGVGTVIDYYRSADAVGKDGEIITFCHTGELSALNWFYASELAGLKDVRLYPESMVGWSQSVGILGYGRPSNGS